MSCLCADVSLHSGVNFTMDDVVLGQHLLKETKGISCFMPFRNTAYFIFLIR